MRAMTLCKVKRFNWRHSTYMKATQVLSYPCCLLSHCYANFCLNYFKVINTQLFFFYCSQSQRLSPNTHIGRKRLYIGCQMNLSTVPMDTLCHMLRLIEFFAFEMCQHLFFLTQPLQQDNWFFLWFVWNVLLLPCLSVSVCISITFYLGAFHLLFIGWKSVCPILSWLWFIRGNRLRTCGTLCYKSEYVCKHFLCVVHMQSL